MVEVGDAFGRSSAMMGESLGRSSVTGQEAGLDMDTANRGLSHMEFGASFPVQCPALGFVEQEQFQMFIGAVIGANVVIVALETDTPDLSCWAVFDNLFQVTFTVEIAMRLTHRGVYWFHKERYWAVFDAVVVGLGVFDLWITPLILRQGVVNHRTSVIRMLRMMRLMRLIRVFKMFPTLMRVSNAIIEVLGTFAWIFSVLFLFIVCCAIVLTHLLGHGEGLPDRSDVEPESQAAYDEARFLVQKMFRNVLSSVFTLFQVTTTDNWEDIAYPVIYFSWKWRFFFVFYIAFASWTMISVLTAIAADNMIAATSDRKDAEQREVERRQQAFIQYLRTTFYEADTDGNGLLDREEFDALMEQDNVTKEMGRLGVNMNDEDLRKAWEMLDIDDSGELTIDEFVSGLSYLQEGLSTKHVISIDYSLKRVAIRLSLLMDNLKQDIDCVRELNEKIVESLQKHEDNCEQMQLFLWLWHQWSKEHDPNAVPLNMAGELPDCPPPLTLREKDDKNDTGPEQEANHSEGKENETILNE